MSEYKNLIIKARKSAKTSGMTSKSIKSAIKVARKKVIKLVLDTNVFMSGIFWAGHPARILDVWSDGKIKLIVSPEILNEYIRVGNILSKKYPGVDISPFIDLVTVYGEFVSPVILKEPISRDADDDKFNKSMNCG